MDTAVSGETPSGKGAGDENFPVGLFKDLFDVIIGGASTNGAPGTTLNGANTDPAYAKAHALRKTLNGTGISAAHGLDLISAFKQDAVKPRYENWQELIDYCLRSAAPVGRFLCDLHGEDKALYPLSDALCNALQVINHLQDCAKDYADMDRVYLPQEWMRAEGTTVEDLKKPSATPGLRRVLDHCVVGTEALMAEARKLPKAMKHRSLAAETAVIVSVADELTQRLGRQDPLAMRVALKPLGYVSAVTRGLFRLWVL